MVCPSVINTIQIQYSEQHVILIANISRYVAIATQPVHGAPIVNPPNSAQLRGIPHHSPKLHPGPCNSVGMRPRTDTHTHKHTDRQTRTTTIHFASSTTHAKCRPNQYIRIKYDDINFCSTHMPILPTLCSFTLVDASLHLQVKIVQVHNRGQLIGVVGR